jgi:hypothetical protein
VPIEPCAGDGKEPGQHLGAGLEPIGMAPCLDKDFTDQILSGDLAAHEPHQEPEDPNFVARIEDLHGTLVALGDQPHQDLIGGLFRIPRRPVSGRRTPGYCLAVVHGRTPSPCPRLYRAVTPAS